MNVILNLSSQNMFLMLLLLSALLLLISIWSFFALRSLKLKKLKVELQHEKTLNQFQQLKSIVSPKYTLGSQIIEDKLQKIHAKLSIEPFRKFTEVHIIKSDILQIKELLSQWRSSIDRDQTLFEFEQYTQELPGLKKLNFTEKRILFYCIRGFSTTDISMMMSISQQHVRNSKSKIQKTLSEEMGREISLNDIPFSRLSDV